MSTDAVDTEVSYPLVRPPKLNTGQDRAASRLELFFDLAYVLVVLELAAGFVDDFSWGGLVTLAGLFAAVWLSWSGFTLYANRFDTDDVVFRLVKLGATAAVAGCAASASDATGAYAVPFTVCSLLGRLILLGLYLRAWRHVTEARSAITVYLLTLGVSAALWGASLLVDGTGRYLMWAVAVVVEASGPFLATLRGDAMPIQIEHLPERFGLFVILVLGEAVGGAVRGVHDAKWATPSVLIAGVGFLVAAAMWWIYFNVGAAESVDELDGEDGTGDDERTDSRHDLFIYGHLPLTFGVVLSGVGIEELALHPSTDLPSAYGWVLAGGVVIFLAGVAMIVGGTVRRWRAVWPWPLAAIPLVAILGIVPINGGLVQGLIYTAILGTVAVHGTLQQRHRSRPG